MKELDFKEELISACCRGDRRAQQRLYQLYAKAMYNICVRMLKTEADAEDVLQNSFIDVFKNLKNYKAKATPGAWIKRIVVNNCINHLRKRKVHFTELNESVYNAEDTQVDESSDNYTVQKIQTAMNQLPDGYRVVFSLYAMEGYDHKEISGILGISEATSKTQYHRAKKKLKSMVVLN